MTNSNSPKPAAPDSGKGPADATASATDTETPIDRAIRHGQGDVINPSVPTGQTPEQMRDELVEPDSNDELHIAARKRADADGTSDRGGKSDERGFTQR